MRNAVWLDFGLKGIVKGDGYGFLKDALFKPGTTVDEMAFFMFGAFVDSHLFQKDWLLDSLRLIGCSEAILFTLLESTGGTEWTAVRYGNILEGHAEKTWIPHADELYRTKFSGGQATTTPAVVEPPQRPKPPEIETRTEPGGPGLLQSVGRALSRWAFGR